MVEESGTLESQLEATKVSAPRAPSLAKTRQLTTPAGLPALKLGAGWASRVPLSPRLKAGWASIILKKFFVSDGCYLKPCLKRVSSGPWHIRFTGQVCPLVRDAHAEIFPSSEAADVCPAPQPTFPFADSPAGLRLGGPSSRPLGLVTGKSPSHTSLLPHPCSASTRRFEQ